MPTCEFCKIVVTDGLDRHYNFCMSLDSDDGSIRSEDSDTRRHQQNPYQQEPHQQPGNNQPRTRHVDQDDMHIDYDFNITSERLGGTLLPWQYRRFNTEDDTESISSSIFDESELENYFDYDSQSDGVDDFPILNNPNPQDTIDFRFLPTLSNDDYWNVRLSNIAQKHGISRDVHEELIKFCNDWKNDSKFRTGPLLDSVYLSNKKMLNVFPVSSELYHVCKNGCMLFERDNQHFCDHCNESRYSFRYPSKPVATMRYLPISEMLGAMFANSNYREMVRKIYNRPQEDSITDIFDGSVFSTFADNFFSNEFDIGLALYVDAFTPFHRGQNSSLSMTIIHLIVLNLPKEERYKLKNMIQVAVIPGPHKPKDIHSFLSPLMRELSYLSTKGAVLKYDDEEIYMRAHLLLASGDIPGVADLIHHSGHGSHHGCRVCRIESTSLISPKGAGYGQYFPGSEELDPERTIEDFKGEMPEFGIELPLRAIPNPFPGLPTHHVPFFYGLDEMHLIGQNIARSVYAMFKGEYENATTPFALSRPQQAAIGEAIKSSRLSLPLDLDGMLIDVFIRPKSARAVDWIDFMLYVVPTLVVENLEENSCSSLDALKSLVTTCSIALSWDISTKTTNEGDIEIPSDIDRLTTCVNEWHQFMLNGVVPHNLYNINHHYLRHLPEIVEKLGNPRSYSARSMERAIGELKKYIKSRVAPGANASNALVKIAASRYYERQFGDKSITMEADAASNVIHLGNEEGDPEFWGPPVLRDVPINAYQDLNLIYYLQNYWSLAKKRAQVPITSTLQTVAPKLFFGGNTYDSLAFQNNRSAKPSYFVTVMLPVDLNARRRRAKCVNAWRRFFCEIELFFVHEFEGEQKMLCLVNIIENVQLNGVGAPYGTAQNGTRRYVTEVQYIEGFAGMLGSSTYADRVYYLYKGMDLGSTQLGSTADHLVYNFNE